MTVTRDQAFATVTAVLHAIGEPEGAPAYDLIVSVLNDVDDDNIRHVACSLAALAAKLIRIQAASLDRDPIELWQLLAVRLQQDRAS